MSPLVAIGGLYSGANILGVSEDTSSHVSLEGQEHSQHFGDGNDNIPLCAGFGKE